MTFYVASALPHVFAATIRDVDSRAVSMQYPPCQGVVGGAEPVVTDLAQPPCEDVGKHDWLAELGEGC